MPSVKKKVVLRSQKKIINYFHVKKVHQLIEESLSDPQLQFSKIYIKNKKYFVQIITFGWCDFETKAGLYMRREGCFFFSFATSQNMKHF